LCFWQDLKSACEKETVNASGFWQILCVYVANLPLKITTEYPVLCHWPILLTYHPCDKCFNFSMPPTNFKPTKKQKSVACSPQENYTNRATAACRQSLYQLLQIEDVAWSAQRIPTAVNLGFLDRSRYFLEIVSQLSSRAWVDPVPGPLLLRKSSSYGIRTRDLWICSQELWSLDHKDRLQAHNGIFISFLNSARKLCSCRPLYFKG
jgi:hypothetical protein